MQLHRQRIQCTQLIGQGLQPADLLAILPGTAGDALLDTRLGLGLILTIVNLPLALVILVNAIRDLPAELDEAALMDGASRTQILLRVVTPLCRPAIVTSLIFGFITAWNEFLFGLMLTTSKAVPVTVGASFFFAASGGGVQWGVASAVMIVSEQALQDHGLTPLARIVNLTVTAGDPVIMLEEPLFATDRALQRAGLSIGDIDLYEVNEAFAPVPMAWLNHVGADPDRLNVNGGAIALGHPLGASGTKLMATLVHALRKRGGRYGLQTMCEGGGIANVTIVEAL